MTNKLKLKVDRAIKLIQSAGKMAKELGDFKADRRLGCLCCPLLSKPKRIASFKRHQSMVRFYIRAIKKYLQTHSTGRTTQLFSNPYDLFASQVFCAGQRQFLNKFGVTPLFAEDAADTKSFLEQQFGVKL